MLAASTQPLRAWSHSRSQTMNTCQRQFFLSYCAGARWDHPDPRLRELSLLKQVKPIAMWKGDVIHQSLAQYFRNLSEGRVLPLAQLTRWAEEMARTQWAFSSARRYRKEGRYRAGDAFAALFEHEYNIEDAESLDDAIAHVRESLINFYKIDREQSISAIFKKAKNRLIEPPAWGEDATTFLVPGVKVTVKVDLAFSTADGRYLIFDWKTGKGETEATPQLELYILWAHLAVGQPLESIVGHEVSLFRGTLSACRLTESGKHYRLQHIQRSADLIAALTDDGTGAGPQLRDFSYARHVAICQRCPLQRVCQEFP